MYYGQPPPNQQPQHQQPNQPQFPGTEYLKNVSPEMINFGLNAGQDILNKQRDKWMPGVSGFWNSLKYYFSVITLLLYFFKALVYEKFHLLGQQFLCY